MTHPNGWQVGMDICAVYSLNRRGDPDVVAAKITKIGRRWISFTSDNRFNDGRFDAETMRIDGGAYSSPGDVYESEDRYRQDCELGKAWSEFMRSLSYTQPKGMTLEKLEQVKAIMFGNAHD